MAGKGETVKYIIDADTSGFSRGMISAAAESELAGRRIDRALSGTSKRSENNFQDIRKNAATAASSIRNFGVAFQAFNLTSVIIGVTALSGALLELSGAIAAAGATGAVLPSIFAQGIAATSALRSGVFGLSDAFSAIAKNDGKAFQESLSKLGPAAREVAFAVGGLNKAMNGVRLNAQNALLQGVGNTLLQLGANILPIVNAGFQTIGSAMNRAFKQAAALAGSPVFGGLLSTIFSDTARTIDTLSGAIGPIFTIFTNLYMITAPYVQLLAEFVVNLTKSGAAFLSSTAGATQFNLAIAHGVIALQQIGSLVGAVFNFLTAIFRTSVESGTSLITTLVGIVNAMTAWVNSATGQAQLASLFQFTALTIQTVAAAVGTALQAFFGLIQVVSSLNPAVQQMIVNFLASSLVLRPVISYFSQLYLAIRVLAVTAFNVLQQLWVFATALGAVASIALLLGGGLIVLGTIIRGPLGGAFIIVGAAIALYIGLSWLLAYAANIAAGSMLRQGAAATQTAVAELYLAEMNMAVTATMLSIASAASAASGGMVMAGRAAMLLQAALIPLLVLAIGIGVILGMLGLLGGKAAAATPPTIGLSGALGGLQKQLKGVGTSGGKAANGGLADLNTGLDNVGQAAQQAQKGLAGFDKMNVLTDKNAGGVGDIGMPAMPKLPSIGDMGGLGGMPDIGMPGIDTADFDKAIADMTGQFDKLKGDIGKGIPNPFAEIGKFIKDNPVPFLIAFAVVLGIIIALFATGAVTIGLATLPLTLIVIAIIAIIAIVILLWQNWDTIWKWITDVAAAFGAWFMGVWNGLLDFFSKLIASIGQWFVDLWNGIMAVFAGVGQWFADVWNGAWNGIKAIWGVVVQWFQDLWNGIVNIFNAVVGFYAGVYGKAWDAIKAVWGVVVSWFQGVWNGIVAIFNGVSAWFGNIFNSAWNAIKGAFGAVTGFFQGVWNSIVSIFGSVGSAIGNAIGGSFKNIINGVLKFAVGLINGFIDAINSAIDTINKIPGVGIGRLGRLPVPQLAKGGVVTSSTFAEIGEDGAEAVMPLENNTGWIDMLAAKINSANGSSGGQPIQLTVQIGEDKIATKVIDLINEKTQMSGRNSILV